MHGATVVDWLSLLRYNSTSSCIHQYVHSHRILIEPVIPWFVKWFITHFHPKHVFVGKVLPKLERITDDLDSFCNAFKYRVSLGQGPERLLSYRPKGWRTPACTNIVDPGISFWLKSFKARVLGACEKQLRRVRGHTRLGNMFPLVRRAVLWLKSSTFTVHKNDKEAGYTLTTLEDDRAIDTCILEKPEYEEVSEHDINFDTVAKSYCRLAHDIEKWAGTPIARDILRSLSFPGHSVRARLTKTCKTHKPQGAIVFRNIHAAGRYAFCGLAKWLSGHLQRRLKDFPHIVKDTKAAVDRLKAVNVVASDLICTVDVREFYMSGSINELISDVLVWFTDPVLKSLIERSLWILLGNQYVHSPHFLDRLWKVIRGSGMGLPHSGEVADLALLTRMERWALTHASVHDISAYLRFRDDIIIIGKSAHSLGLFVRGLRSRSAYFVLEVDKFGREGVGWLEICISIRPRRLEIRPKFKDTTLSVPLLWSSAHPRHVHLSWPRARLQYLKQLCSSPSFYPAAKNEFISRLSMSYTRYQVRLVTAEPVCAGAAPRASQRRSIGVTWCKLPFHPALEDAIQKAIASFLQDEMFRSILMRSLGWVPQVRVSYYRCLPTLAHMLVNACGVRLG